MESFHVSKKCISKHCTKDLVEDLCVCLWQFVHQLPYLHEAVASGTALCLTHQGAPWGCAGVPTPQVRPLKGQNSKDNGVSWL